MSVFDSKRTSARLSTRLDEISRRVDESEDVHSELEERLDEIERVLADVLTTTRLGAPDVHQPTTTSSGNDARRELDGDELDELRAALGLPALEAQVDRISGRLAQVAVQLSELRVQVSAPRDADTDAADAALHWPADVRDAYHALQRDQARIESLFREDLASLTTLVHATLQALRSRDAAAALVNDGGAPIAN